VDVRFLTFQMKAARSFIISRTTHPVLQCHTHKTTAVWKPQNLQIVRSLFLKFVLWDVSPCGVVDRQIPSSSTVVKQV